MSETTKINVEFWAMLAILAALVAFLLVLAVRALNEWVVDRRYSRSEQDFRRTVVIEGTRAAQLADDRTAWNEAVEAARRLRLERGVTDDEELVEVVEDLEAVGDLEWVPA